MKLPSLDSLDKEVKTKPLDKEVKTKPLDKEVKTKPKQSSPKSKAIAKETKAKERKSIIPKSEYHPDGTPVLAIPDLDDVNLAKEIDKYFENMKTSK